MTRINRRIQGEYVVLDSPVSGDHLEIQETAADGVGRLAITGKLTAEMANDLEDEMISMALLCEKVVLDMKNVPFISNTAAGKILEVQHVVDAKDGTLGIINVSRPVYETFEEMGLESVFDIEPVDNCIGEDI